MQTVNTAMMSNVKARIMDVSVSTLAVAVKEEDEGGAGARLVKPLLWGGAFRLAQKWDSDAHAPASTYVEFVVNPDSINRNS